MRLIQGALKNPHLVIVAILAVVVLGVTSLSQIPADLLPIFETSAVQIVTFYPGMPPEVMERDIMSRLERWTGQSVGIEHQEAKAMLGVCIVKDFFREGISMDTAMSQVTSYAMSDMFYLPPGTIPPMVMPFDPTASTPLCLVSVSSPSMNEKELYDIAYFELRNRLQSIQGVIAPAVYGGKLRRILAYVDRNKLEALNLSPMDVVRTLKEQNVFVPAGNLKSGRTDYQIFANAMPKKVSDLNDAPIAIRNGAVIFLGDVADAQDSHQIQSNIVRVNGKRQVYIPIYRQPGANTIAIVDGIRSQLERILQRLKEMNPKAADLALEVVVDQSVYVRESIRGLEMAAILGAVLAGVVVFVFLRSFRSTVVICLAIPLAMLAAFIGLFYTKDSINSMTLGGLALAVGILVDQSIVVLENVVRHGRMGKTAYQAALDGASEVIAPIFVSSLTFIVVFYPIVFLSGMTKFLFTPLALAASFAILSSFLLSITLIPAYCARFLKLGDETKAAEAKPPRFMTSYGSLLKGLIRGRWGVILVAVAGFAVAVVLMMNLGTELFPAVDAGQFTIYTRLPSGTRIEVTEATVQAIEKEIMDVIGEPDPRYPAVEDHKDSNLKMLISNIGVLMDWPAAYTPNTGPMDAFHLVQLKAKPGATGTFDYVSVLRERLNDSFPQVDFAFDTGGMLTAALNFGEPSPIHIQVSGSSFYISHRIAKMIVEEVEKVPGTADVRISQRVDYPTLDVDIDRTLAAYAGLTMEDVIKNLVTATNSSINFDPAFWIDENNGNHYFIGAQYREADLVSLDTLMDIPITGPDSTTSVPLRNLATISRGTGPAVISHRNITRVIDVYANVLTGYDLGSVVTEIENRLASSEEISPTARTSVRGKYFEVGGDEFAGKGYSYVMTGEIHTMRESFSQFLQGLIIAIILIYLVMVAQFRSFRDPFIILMSVPLGFIGVALILFGTGVHLSIPAFMGIILMTGIVVEYGIILVDFANRRLGEGLSIQEAIVDAAQTRLRPILMTSLTTVLALTPMAVGIGGGEANIPLARAVIGGVLGATALTLLVAPCLYVIVKRPLAKAVQTSA